MNDDKSDVTALKGVAGEGGEENIDPKKTQEAVKPIGIVDQDARVLRVVPRFNDRSGRDNGRENQQKRDGEFDRGEKTEIGLSIEKCYKFFHQK